jgi:hypothetical protein
MPLGKASSTFYVVRATLEKYGLHVNNIKFNAQNKEQINIHIILPVFLCAMCNKNID